MVQTWAERNLSQQLSGMHGTRVPNWLLDKATSVVADMPDIAARDLADRFGIHIEVARHIKSGNKIRNKHGDVLKPAKCGTCGAMVYMPCLLCSIEDGITTYADMDERNDALSTKELDKPLTAEQVQRYLEQRGNHTGADAREERLDAIEADADREFP